VLAVERKNYGEARLVSIKEVRDFQSKLDDLSGINHAMFVTNIRFSSEAEGYAKHKRIELWDGEKLRGDFYLLNLGRLESSETTALAETILDCALPIKIQYNEATKLLLVNPHATSIETTLDLHPYYLFTPSSLWNEDSFLIS
jgi:Restriction endonuclease